MSTGSAPPGGQLQGQAVCPADALGKPLGYEVLHGEWWPSLGMEARHFCLAFNRASAHTPNGTCNLVLFTGADLSIVPLHALTACQGPGQAGSF